MLAKKIKESTSQIKSYNDYERLSLTKKDLDRLKIDVDKLNIRVEQYVNMNSILENYAQYNSEVVFNEGKYINSQINLILSNIVNNNFSKYESVKKIETTIDRYHDNLKDAWRQTYIRDTQGTISILIMLEKLYNDSFKILQIRNKVKQLENKWPFMSEDLDKMQEGINEANSIIRELKVSSNIQGFLQSVSSGEASILDLDEEILSWLKDNRFENKVKLSFV